MLNGKNFESLNRRLYKYFKGKDHPIGSSNLKTQNMIHAINDTLETSRKKAKKQNSQSPRLLTSQAPNVRGQVPHTWHFTFKDEHFRSRSVNLRLT